MFAAPGTAFGGLTADKAAPLRKAKFLPRQLPSVGIKDIHIKKTAQTILIFKACRNVFHDSCGPVEDIVFFIAGLIIDDFMKKDGNPCSYKGLFQTAYTFFKPYADKGRHLLRSRDVHRKKQQRFVEPLEELPLSQGPTVPSPQHIGDFHAKFRRYSEFIFHSSD